MTSIHLTVTGARARASVTGPLTSGMVGIPVTIEYDEAWDGLTKNLMCRCSPWGSDDGENRAILNVGESAAVAHEVMRSDMYLYLGVEGFSDDGKLVIPTTWAECGKIEYGANTCEDPTTDPELTVWNQLQTEIEQIKGSALTQEQAADIQACAQEAIQAAREARQAADEAKQAANTGGSGLYYTPVVTQPTSDTLRFEFKPSVTGGPVPKPVTVELPVCGDSDENTSGGLTTEQIDALNGMFRAAGYDGDAAYAAAYAAFQAAFELDSGGAGTDKKLVSISASYSGGAVPVGTAVTDLTGIVVTATYDDGSTAAVTGYTLSGTIAEGSNTITVAYQGVTATFVVTGTTDSGDVLDTSPIIEYEHRNLSQDDGSLVESDNCSVTKFYEFGELTAQRDFAYMTGSNAIAAAHNADGTWKQWFAGRTTEKVSHMPVGAAKIRFAIHGNYLNKSYAYWTDTGEVIFAAPRSEHYGKTHVTLAESEATA